MKKLKFNLNSNLLIVIVFLFLILLTFFTRYYGTTDTGDYSETAKFFAGDLNSKVRNSHSYLYGFIHAPFVALTENFIFFKVSSLFFLSLIILSVYYLSGKNRKALWITLLSPVVWYMAPWISPIQLSSLFLLWSWYFINKYDNIGEIKYLLYSGIFLGLGWAFWDTILFFGFFLFISFMYNKKFYHSIYFFIFVLIGLLPRLILDQHYFGFAFFSILKSFFGTLTNAFFLGRGTPYSLFGFFSKAILFILILVSIPLCFWRCYRKNFLFSNLKTIFFLSLSLLLILLTPQIRYVLAIVPIIIVFASKDLSDKFFVNTLKFSLIFLLIFSFPNIIQINHSFNNSNYYDITAILTQKVSVTSVSDTNLILSDLSKVSLEFPNQTFVVGNLDDNYQELSRIYWGKNIKEFVSIQDYNLWLKNSTSIFEKRFVFIPYINDRRSIWIGGGITKNLNDATNYSSIKYGLSINESLGLNNFYILKKYQILTLWKKKL